MTFAFLVSKKLSSDMEAETLVCVLSPGRNTTSLQSKTTVDNTLLYVPLILASIVPLISFEDAPISNMYLPGSKVRCLFFASQNQRSAQSISIETVLVCPLGMVILLKPFKLFIGLCSDAALPGVFT